MSAPKKTVSIPAPPDAESAPPLSVLLLDLMRRYQAADGVAADELIERLTPILSRYYYGLTANPRILEDLLQECWLRIHRSRQSYRPGEPVLPWVLAIARHTRVDQYRRWRRSSGRESSIDELIHHPAADTRQSLDNRLEAGGILAILEKLPQGQREVLTMLKVGGMSVQEVALATRSSVPAVKQKAYRAYQAIREALGIRREEREKSDEV